MIDKKKLWAFCRAGVNKVFVHNVNGPVPTGPRVIGTIHS